jgi:hypothetical protein
LTGAAIWKYEPRQQAVVVKTTAPPCAVIGNFSNTAVCCVACPTGATATLTINFLLSKFDFKKLISFLHISTFLASALQVND